MGRFCVKRKRSVTPAGKKDSKPVAKKLKTSIDLPKMKPCFVKLERLSEAITLKGFVTLPKKCNEKDVKADSPVPLPDSIPSMSLPNPFVNQSPSVAPRSLLYEYTFRRSIRKAILRAAENGNLRYLKHISISDVSKNLQGLANKRGETPLIIACTKDHPTYLSVIRFLVEIAKVDVKESGVIWSAGDQGTRKFIGTALHAAVFAGNFRAVSYLAEVCPSIVDEVTLDGSTALHLAARHLTGANQREIVHRLLSYGADCTIENRFGKQCWQLIYGMDFVILMAEYWRKYGMSAANQERKPHIEMLYCFALAVFNRRYSSHCTSPSEFYLS